MAKPEIGTDTDQAVINVNNRAKQAEARLPQEVRRQGIQVEKNSSSFLQVLAFSSPDGRYDDLYTSNYVTLNVLDVLKRVPGTTNVQIFGAKDYAMRVWLKPDRLAQLDPSGRALIPGLRRRPPLRDQPGLADPGLPGDEHGRAAPVGARRAAPRARGSRSAAPALSPPCSSCG